MRKIIKKIGTSAGVYLTCEERKVYNLEIGDIIEITIQKVKK